MLFLWYPRKSHILNPPCFFFWNSPLNLLSKLPCAWCTTAFNWKWPFSDRKHHTKYKKIHNSAKTWYFDKMKSFWKLICFCYFCQKKIVFHFGHDPYWPHCSANRAPKIIFLEVLFTFFFRATGLQQRLLILFESPNILYWKLTKEKKVGVVLRAKFAPN